jgi:2-polyprenyl-3-methyl-5-hydroxy-6-metoxy-1,4-benzoquinol methylase
MSEQTLKDHWNTLYASNNSDQVSWYQSHASQSLAFIASSGLAKSARIIDVGGESSSLASDLLRSGFTNTTALDLSHEAIQCAKIQLKGLYKKVKWIETDILSAKLPVSYYDLCHYRGV